MELTFLFQIEKNVLPLFGRYRNGNCVNEHYSWCVRCIYAPTVQPDPNGSVSGNILTNENMPRHTVKIHLECDEDKVPAKLDE